MTILRGVYPASMVPILVVASLQMVPQAARAQTTKNTAQTSQAKIAARRTVARATLSYVIRLLPVVARESADDFNSYILELICLLVNAGEPTQAIQLSHQIKDTRTRISASLLIGKGYARAGEADAARRLFSQATSDTRKLTDPDEISGALQEIARVWVSIGDLTRAAETVEQITDPEERQGSYTFLAPAYADAGDYAIAVRTAGRIVEAVSAIYTLCAIGRTQAEAGDINGARRTIALAVNRLNDLPEAKLLNPERRSEWVIIARAQAAVGDYEAALQSVSQIPHERWQREALVEIAVEQAKANDIRAAVTTVERLDEERERGRALERIIRELVKGGDFAVVKQGVHRLPIALQGSPLLKIAMAQAELGDFTEAFVTAEEAPEVEVTANILGTIAKTQREKGDINGARQTLIKAVNLLRNRCFLTVRPELVCDLASLQLEAGDISGARQTITFAEAAAHRPPQPRSGSEDVIDCGWVHPLCTVAVLKTKVGDLQGAYATIADFPENADLSWTWKGIAMAQARAGNVKEALEVTRGIVSPDERTLCQTQIAQLSIRAGDQALGRKILQMVRLTVKEDRTTDSDVMMNLYYLAATYARLGDVKEAVTTIDLLPQAAKRATVACMVARSLLEGEGFVCDCAYGHAR